MTVTATQAISHIVIKIATAKRDGTNTATPPMTALAGNTSETRRTKNAMSESA